MAAAEDDERHLHSEVKAHLTQLSSVTTEINVLHSSTLASCDYELVE